MNPVATGALLAIAFAQLLQVVILWAPPQEIHFRAAQEFCKQKAGGAVDGYFECMARLTK